MRRVFVIQDNGKLDFSRARQFGELVPMIERDVFPDDAEERVETVKRILGSKLSSFNPQQDYLLLTGDPVAIMLAGLEIYGQGVTDFNILKWDKEHNGYYPVAIHV